jgi:DNA-binding MarR family transcriptional regulator
MGRLMGQVLERKLHPLGITYQEMRIVGLLMGEDAITQKDLAEKLSVRAPTLSVAVSKLEVQGLVTRVPSPKDKRANFLRLNKSPLITQVDELVQQMESKATEGISERDLKTTAKVLAHIIEQLKTAD